MDLFAYGTLTDPIRMNTLLKRTPAGPEPAILRGWVRRETTEGYPVILPGEPDDLTPGVVWRGISPAERATLDEYEDLGQDPAPYFLRQVYVETARGREEVWVYIGNPNYWTPERLL